MTQGKAIKNTKNITRYCCTHRSREEGGIREVVLDESALLDALHAVQSVQHLTSEVGARVRLAM